LQASRSRVNKNLGSYLISKVITLPSRGASPVTLCNLASMRNVSTFALHSCQQAVARLCAGFSPWMTSVDRPSGCGRAPTSFSPLGGRLARFHMKPLACRWPPPPWSGGRRPAVGRRGGSRGRILGMAIPPRPGSGRRVSPWEVSFAGGHPLSFIWAPLSYSSTRAHSSYTSFLCGCSRPPATRKRLQQHPRCLVRNRTPQSREVINVHQVSKR